MLNIPSQNRLAIQQLVDRMSLKTLLEMRNLNQDVTDEMVSGTLKNRTRALLQGYFLNVDNFITLMEDNPVLISGSSVLEVINPEFVQEWATGPPKDLDVYTAPSFNDVLIDYLMQEEQYQIGTQLVFPNTVPAGIMVPHPLAIVNNQDAYGRADVGHLITVTHLSNASGKHIDVVCCLNENFLIPILNFHSTLVVNAIHPKFLFVGYPQYTFEQTLLINPSYEPTEDIQMKYVQRGYIVVENNTLWAPPALQGPRHALVQDAGALLVPIDADEEEPLPLIMENIVQKWW